MTEDEIKFDAIFVKNGGLYDINQPGFSHSSFLILAKFKDTAEMFIEDFRTIHPKMPPVHFNFAKSLSINAGAAYHEGKAYIGMNIGLYYLALDVFNKMFSTRSVLTDIGNVNNETQERKVISATKNLDGNVTYNTDNLLMPPNDEIRFNYAKIYFTLVIEFLMYHEMGHIIRGHCGYLNTPNLSSIWNEFPVIEISATLNKINFQTMEMDADSFAVNNIINKALNIIRNGAKRDLFINVIYKDLKTFVKHWCFAIYTFFRLWGLDSFNEDDSRVLSHPPAYIRFSMMSINIIGLMKVYELTELEDISTTIWKSIHDAERAFSEVSFYESRLDMFIENFHNAENYSKEIIVNWNNVRPLIEKFAFEPENLPPLVT